MIKNQEKCFGVIRSGKIGIVDHFSNGIPTMEWIQEQIGDFNLRNCTIVIDNMALELYTEFSVKK